MLLPYVVRPGFNLIISPDLTAGLIVATHIELAVARGASEWAACRAPALVLRMSATETRAAVVAAQVGAGATPEVMQNIIVESIGPRQHPKERLSQAIKERSPALVVIHPLMAFLSETKEKEIWKVGPKLRDDAEAGNYALVGIMHADLHKKTVPKVAAAWIAVATCTLYCWGGDPEKDGTENILMVHYHAERGRETGVAQEFTQAAWVQAHPDLRIKNVTMPSSAGARRPTEEERAKDYVRRVMAEGMTKGGDIIRRGEQEEGLSRTVVYRARDLMGVETKNGVWVFPEKSPSDEVSARNGASQSQSQPEDTLAASQSQSHPVPAVESQSQAQAANAAESPPGPSPSAESRSQQTHVGLGLGTEGPAAAGAGRPDLAELIEQRASVLKGLGIVSADEATIQERRHDLRRRREALPRDRNGSEATARLLNEDSLWRRLQEIQAELGQAS